MHSLFEEQLALEQQASVTFLDAHEDAFSEATSFVPSTGRPRLGPDEYLEQIRALKSAVSVPVIASLNGTSRGGWLDFSCLIAEAGADALELNAYHLATDPDEPGHVVEQRIVEMLESVKFLVSIPVAVKLSPFHSALAHFARQLDRAGADGLVLFNRFYQADVDVDRLEVERHLHLSDSHELLLRLRWLAILSGRIDASLAASGGVHTAIDAIKAVMTGAHAVQVVSAILRRGPQVLDAMLREIAEWLEEHEYDSLRQMRGSMSLVHCPDPKAYERANYMHVLQSWER
jgi:dihydroorotate dehydrogenase (fumarate)